MLCSWEVSSLKAWPWQRRLNRKPHLTHLSSVSGSMFLGINAHPLVLFYVAQLSVIADPAASHIGCETHCPAPTSTSQPNLSCFLTPCISCTWKEQIALLRKKKNVVGNWIIINVCDFGWMAQIPSFSIYFLNSLIDTFLWKHGFVQSFNLV